MLIFFCFKNAYLELYLFWFIGLYVAIYRYQHQRTLLVDILFMDWYFLVMIQTDKQPWMITFSYFQYYFNIGQFNMAI